MTRCAGMKCAYHLLFDGQLPLAVKADLSGVFSRGSDEPNHITECFPAPFYNPEFNQRFRMF